MDSLDKELYAHLCLQVMTRYKKFNYTWLKAQCPALNGRFDNCATFCG